MKTSHLIVAGIAIAAFVVYRRGVAREVDLVAQARTNLGGLVDTATPDNVGALGLL